MNDPYPLQLKETATAVAGRLQLTDWRVGWQSAGRTHDAWLGPDICELIPALGAEGASGVVVCPCGFVADHLEVLYDLDIEAAGVAAGVGLPFARTDSPNDDGDFLDVVANKIRSALTGSGS